MHSLHKAGFILTIALLTACGSKGSGGGAPDSLPTKFLFDAGTQRLLRGEAISIAPTLQGGANVKYSVSPALPLGLSLDAATGTISGSPILVRPAAQDYVVSAANGAGSLSAPLSLAVDGQWTWVAGPKNSASYVGNYGTQRLAAASNNPGGRQFPGLYADGNGTVSLFGGYGFASLNSVGGLADIWSFSNGLWTWIWGSSIATPSSPTYGTINVPSSLVTPGAREYGTNWHTPDGNWWVFGGGSFGGNLRNDTWKYDGTAWTWVAGSSAANDVGTYLSVGSNGTPRSRMLNASAVDKDGNLYMFGGYDGTNLLCDLWKFDGQHWTWVWGSPSVNLSGIYGTKGVAASTNRPGCRYAASLATDAQGRLWLFGGYGADVNAYNPAAFQNMLGDLWKFENGQWTWMSGPNTTNAEGVFGTQGVADANNRPGAREEHRMWVDQGGYVWIWGGWGVASQHLSFAVLNDLWMFDGSQWTWLSGSNLVGASGTYGTQSEGASTNTPGARLGAASSLSSDGTVWLFGGAGYDETTAYGQQHDLWKF